MMRKRIVQILVVSVICWSFVFRLSSLLMDATESDEIELFNNNNIYGVQNGPSSATTFTIDQEYVITRIVNYHYFNNGVLPGTISIKHSDGTVYGPWKAEGSLGQGNVDNAYWTVMPNERIMAGTYTIMDSDSSTWSMNSESGNQGFSIVTGYPSETSQSDAPAADTGNQNKPLDEAAWVFIGTRTNNWEDNLKLNNESTSWQWTVDYTEGHVAFANTYIGPDGGQYGDSWVRNGIVQAGIVTWTSPSLTVIKPGEQFSVQLTTANTRLDHSNFSGIGSISAQVFRLNQEGNPSGSASDLVDHSGNSFFISSVANAYEPTAATVFGSIGSGSQEGDQMTIRINAVGGVSVETWYIYEWTLAKEAAPVDSNQGNESTDTVNQGNESTDNVSQGTDVSDTDNNNTDNNNAQREIRVSYEPGLIETIIEEAPLFPENTHKNGVDNDGAATENGGFGNVGNIPGPSNATEAAVAVIVPSVVTILISLLSGIGGGSSPMGGTPIGVNPLSNTPLGGGRPNSGATPTSNIPRVSQEPGVITVGNEPYIDGVAEDNTLGNGVRVSQEPGVITVGNEPYIDGVAEDNTLGNGVRVSQEPGVITVGNEPYIDGVAEDNTLGNGVRVDDETKELIEEQSLEIDEDTAEGYDSEGYDAEGYNEKGFNAEGYNEEGYNTEGYDQSGFNKDGYDRERFDRVGYDAQGFNREGYNAEGYDVEGYNMEGYDADGYNRADYDVEGYNSQGYNKDGYNRAGYNAAGYNEKGFNAEGYNKEGFNAEGFNVEGFDKEGYDQSGFNKDGYDRERFNRDGYDVEGYNREGYSATGYNRLGYNKRGFDREGFDKEGYDSEGYDREGYNREGVNAEGYQRSGASKVTYDEKGRPVYVNEAAYKAAYDHWLDELKTQENYIKSLKADYERYSKAVTDFDPEGTPFDVAVIDADGNVNNHPYVHIPATGENEDAYGLTPDQLENLRRKIELEENKLEEIQAKEPQLGKPSVAGPKQPNPEPSMPVSNVPDTDVPEAKLPDTDVPESTLPVSNMPEASDLNNEPESLIIKTSNNGAETLLVKDPVTGGWVNSESGNEVDLEKYIEDAPEQFKQVEDFLKHNDDLEKSGQTAMQKALDNIQKKHEDRFNEIQKEINNRRLEQLKKDMVQLEYEQRVAAKQNNLGKILGNTVINIGDESIEAAVVIGTGVIDGLVETKEIIKDVWKYDLISKTAKGTYKDIDDGLSSSYKSLTKLKNDIVKNPMIVVDAGIYVGKESALLVGKVGKAVVDTLRDPKKMLELVKDSAGYNDILKSWDPNVNIFQRFKHLAIGGFKLGTTVSGIAKAGSLLKGKLANILESKAGGLGSFVDDLFVNGRKIQVPKGINPKMPTQFGPKYVTSPRAADIEGITEASRKIIQNTADDFGVQIHARPTTPYAKRLLEAGDAMPKPADIKAKTLSKLDELIGGPKYSEGVVGYYKPKLPSKEFLDKLPKGDKEKVVKLYVERRREFTKLAKDMKELEKKGYKVINKKIVKDGKLLTGDVDIYDITNFDGKPIDPKMKEKIMDILEKKAGSNVKHKDLVAWDQKSGTLDLKAKASMINAAGANAKNAKGLTSFNPLSKVTNSVHFDTPIPASKINNFLSGKLDGITENEMKLIKDLMKSSGMEV